MAQHAMVAFDFPRMVPILTMVSLSIPESRTMSAHSISFAEATNASYPVVDA